MGFNDNEFVKIDVAHANFLYGLVLSHKPPYPILDGG